MASRLPFHPLLVSAAALALAASALAAPPAGDSDHDHDHSQGTPSQSGKAAATGKAAPAAGQAARTLAQKKIIAIPASGFRPDQPVTRGELAIVLVRMIDYLENQGPRKISSSKSPPLVTPRVKGGLAALPRTHRAYPALARLANGGYLLASGSDGLFLPTKQNIDRPVTARELAAALAGVTSRILEKWTAHERPEVLEQQRESVESPGQRRGINTPEP